MTMITLDHATLETLHNLSEPLILRDEWGRELGTFTPDRDSVPHEEDGRPADRDPVPHEEDGRPARRGPEPWAHLGGSVGT